VKSQILLSLSNVGKVAAHRTPSRHFRSGWQFAARYMHSKHHLVQRSWAAPHPRQSEAAAKRCTWDTFVAKGSYSLELRRLVALEGDAALRAPGIARSAVRTNPRASSNRGDSPHICLRAFRMDPHAEIVNGQTMATTPTKPTETVICRIHRQ
jgi:hypothetical protein